MKALIQRVKQAHVSVDQKQVSAIGQGLLILLGVTHSDQKDNVEKGATKVVNLRIFADQEGKMNLSIKDVKAQALVVSQFTLYGDVEKGRRPSFIQAAPPDVAEPLVDYFVDVMRAHDVEVATGQFGTMMEVGLVNDGPVTFMLEA